MSWKKKKVAWRSIATLFGSMGVCAGCAPGTETGAHGDATLRPALVSQRVSAVVRRQSQQLLYLDTEQQSLVTTPEHPFATVGSGWVLARDLMPGDRVISARFGSLRVSSVRIETRAQPVPVFNLNVDHSHAYLVGKADVLVHNTGCRDSEETIIRKTLDIAETQRELDALKNDPASSSSEQPHERQKRIEALESQLKKLKKHLSAAKSRAKAKNRDETSQEREDATTRNSREIAETQRALADLESSAPTSHEDVLALRNELAELKSKLTTLKNRLNQARYKKKLRSDPSLIERDRHRLPRAEEVRKELAAAQAELDELRRHRTNSGDAAAAPGPREVELEKIIRELAFDLKKEQELQELTDKLAELEETIRSSQPAPPELESEKKKLKELIRKNKTASRVRKIDRKRQAESAVQVREYNRAKRARLNKNYVDDPTRPRDAIGRLEDELAELHDLPSSPGRDWRISYTKARLERLKRLVELRKEHEQVRWATAYARKKREALVQEGKDTKAVDDKLAALEQQRKQVGQQMAVERAREILDGLDEEHPDASHVDDTAPVDQEFLDQIVHELESEQAARQDHLEQNILDVDEELQLINELLASIPSPPAQEMHSAVTRLRSELYDERAQFQSNHFALTNEYAYLNTTVGPGNPAGARRMAEIQAKIQQLGETWRQSTQSRLDDTSGMLRAMQAAPRLRDEAIEAELAGQIALLEQELANPPF